MPSPSTVATNSPPRRLDARRHRYIARELLWDESGLERVRNCGRRSTGDTVTIKVRGEGAERRAGFGGVQSCGSVWSCPVCSEKINAERQSELDAGIKGWLAAGHAVMFGTATLAHTSEDNLADLLDAIGPAWNRTTSGAGAVWNGSKPKKDGTQTEIGDKTRFGIKGYCRVVEIKHGASGWHPHVHFLLFLDAPLHPRVALDLQDRLFGRWQAALGDAGYVTLPGIGMDLRPVRAGEGLADYFTKSNYATSASGAAYEVTGSVTKREGKGGRTPFDLLRDMVELGDADALDLWREYEEATAGRRQLTWSRGLRALLALGVEKTDADLVDDDKGGEIVAVLDGEDYSRLAHFRRLPELLEAAEADDDGFKLRMLLKVLGVLRVGDFTQRDR